MGLGPCLPPPRLRRRSSHHHRLWTRPSGSPADVSDDGSLDRWVVRLIDWGIMAIVWGVVTVLAIAAFGLIEGRGKTHCPDLSAHEAS